MKAIRTVPTAAFAAITPFEMIGGGEYYEAFICEVVLFLRKTNSGGAFDCLLTGAVQLCAEVRVLVPLLHNQSVRSFVHKGRFLALLYCDLSGASHS